MAYVPPSNPFDAEVLYILGTTPMITLAELLHRLGLSKEPEKVKQSLHRLHNQELIDGRQLSYLVRED